MYLLFLNADTLILSKEGSFEVRIGLTACIASETDPKLISAVKPVHQVNKDSSIEDWCARLAADLFKEAHHPPPPLFDPDMLDPMAPISSEILLFERFQRGPSEALKPSELPDEYYEETARELLAKPIESMLCRQEKREESNGFCSIM